MSDELVTRPRGLLLDFGSVISRSLFETIPQIEATLGLAPGSIPWRGPLQPERDPLWQSMQRDEITEREYWAQRAAELGHAAGASGTWQMLDLLQHIRHADPDVAVRPAALALVKAARAAGLRTGILTNELELFYGAAFLERLEVLRHVDCMVDATHTKILKPDPRAYAMACEAMGLPAAQILFVDDQFRNVAGGQRAGLQVQYFDLRDPDGMFAAIAARLRLDRRPT